MSSFRGQIISAGDPGWNQARRGFCARAPYDTNVPDAVMFCRSKDDVVFAINLAQSKEFRFCLRSGRHHYEGASSLARGGLIIDVSEMNLIEFDCTGLRLKVGSGARTAQLYDSLDQRNLTLPLAMSSTVGIAGLTLGGGFGITSRLQGLTCDRMQEVEVILADGKLVTASEFENPDLFWACRGGGGGNFGIVTSFTFDACPIGSTALIRIEYPWSRFTEVVEQFQAWAEASSARIGSFLTLTVERQLSLTAQFTSDIWEDFDLLPFFREMLEPALQAQIRCLEFLPHRKIYRTLMDLDDSLGERQEGQLFKSTSSFAYRPLSREAIEILRLRLENAPHLTSRSTQPSMVQLLTGGGQIASLDSTATAAFHRQAQFVVQFNGYWLNPVDELATVRWVNEFRSALIPFTEGAYVNYADSALQQPLESYFGGNLERLIQVKKAYDPNNFFQGMHSIPVN